MERQLSRANIEEEEDIIYDAKIKDATIKDIYISGLDKKSVQIIIEVDERGETVYYAYETYNHTATRIKQKLEEKPVVRPTIEQGKKVIRLDCSQIYGTVLFEQIDGLDSVNVDKLESQLVDSDNGLNCDVVKVQNVGQNTVVITVRTQYDKTYEFTLTKDDYIKLLDVKDSPTLEGESVVLTKNRNAFDFAEFAVENKNGVILADSFEISDFYPLNSTGLSSLLLVNLVGGTLPIIVYLIAGGYFITGFTLLTLATLPSLYLGIVVAILTRYYRRRVPSSF
jgi:hypothetical protein